MILVYLIGVAVFAAWRGFGTPHGEPGGAVAMVRLYLFALGWPILVAAGIGHGCRMFSLKRLTEDGGRPW